MTAHRVVGPADPVLVGVDGSDAALDAVGHAAREAAQRGRPLRVVHAFVWPLLDAPFGPSVFGPPDGGLRNAAEQIVETAVDRARRAAPGITVHGDVVVGAPAAVLRECARDAVLVVLGDRGLGGFTGLLLGSVAVQVTMHAPAPVLVHRGVTDPALPVLLGVDGSPDNDTVVGFAFEEAARRGVPLHALHAWSQPPLTSPTDMLPLTSDLADVGRQEERVLAEAVAGWQAQHPDVTVQRTLHFGRTRKALIEASRSAQLVVVGTRGRGGFQGLLLGSVSQALLHHAACPVAVVPPSTGTDNGA